MTERPAFIYLGRVVRRTNIYEERLRRQSKCPEAGTRPLRGNGDNVGGVAIVPSSGGIAIVPSS